MVIERVRVKNYRSLADVEVRLGNITVLAGQNGSGKSAFVDVLRFISDSLTLGLDAAVTKRQGINGLRRWSSGRPTDVHVDITVHSPRVDADYAFDIGSANRGTYRVKREYCSARSSRLSDEYTISNGKWSVLPTSLSERGLKEAAIPGIGLILPTLYIEPFYHLHYLLSQVSAYSVIPQFLRTPQEPLSIERLDEHGRNVASILKDLQHENSTTLQEITSALTTIVPEICEINVRQVGGYLSIEFNHMIGQDRPHWFNAAQESDGTLRLVGILTALYHEPAPTLIALEEPELFVHPGALGVLCDVIREASTRSQVILTTHSPELLSRFSADEIRVVERIDGRTEIGKITERQRNIINKRLFLPGELLLAEGLERELERVS